MVDEHFPVLLDTDLGTNIDDALALAYLLRHPLCELRGITTVHGDTRTRAQLASAICRALGHDDVPIHCGAARPLVHVATRWEAPQGAVLGRWSYEARFEPDTAADFLREQIRAQPGRLTLLCIGPLTNVALLFERDPETAALLGRLVCMGGVYFSEPAGYGRVEWNMASDPDASARVCAARSSCADFIGLDVTTQCRLSTDACRARLKAADLDVIADMLDVEAPPRHEVLFHDPLAAAVVFEPDLCRFRTGRVEVRLSSVESTGTTCLVPDTESGLHRVAWAVEAGRFFERYWQTVER
jgi:purine nucleosidase